MDANYWDSTLQTRTNRRRLIAASSMGLAGAALLAACGGGSDGPSGPKDTSGLLTQAENTLAKA